MSASPILVAVLALVVVAVAAGGCSWGGEDRTATDPAAAGIPARSFDGPAGVEVLLGENASDATSVRCRRIGKGDHGRSVPSGYCIVKFESEPQRAFLHKAKRWVEHPIGARDDGLYLR